MKSRHFRPLLLLIALLGAGEARASLFIEPDGGTLLWGDDAAYDDAVIRGRGLTFDFPFFGGEPVTTIDVSSNGNLNFEGNSDYSNEKVVEQIARISPLWDDLAVVKGSGDAVIEKVIPGKLYSVTWRLHENGNPATRHWFQVVLFGAAQRIKGRDFFPGDILFSYAEVGSTFAKDVATVGLDDGGTVVAAPGAAEETAFVQRSEAGLLPTGPGGFILFRATEDGGYVASTQINRAPQVVDDTLYTTGRGAVAIEVRANDRDPDGDPLTIENVTQGALGNVALKPEGGLVYMPGPNFAGTDFFTYTVRDPYGLGATARVILFPFAAGRGNFDGLIIDAPDEDGAVTPTADGAGYLRLMLASDGSFTGVLHFGGRVKSLRGKFDERGAFTTSFERIVDEEPQTVSVTLRLDLANGVNQLTGTIDDGTTTSVITAGQSRFTGKTLPSPQAGKYTVLLRPDESGAGPLGVGYARMSVSRAGTAVMSGKLGSGRGFSFGGKVKTDGTLPFFLRIPAGRELRGGSLSGLVKFDESNLTSDCSATLQWFMPDVGEEFGFEAAPFLIGSRYRPPAKGQRVLSLGDAPRNAAIDLGDSAITNTLTIDAQNRVTVETPNAERVAVTINATNGTFAGGFTEETSDDPPRKKRRVFSGVFLQKEPTGGGLFFDADGAAAAVRITPPIAP